MESFLNDDNSINLSLEDKSIKKSGSCAPSGVGLKKVEKVDYTDTYSHPYFKNI